MSLTETIKDLPPTLTSALIGALVSYIGALIHNSFHLRTKIDETLLDTRTKLYKPLWLQTQLLPKWPKAQNLTSEQLTKFSESLRNWYFAEGGIYLSQPARKAYGKLQEELTNAVQSPGSTPHVTDSHYDAIQKRCSRLRSQLTKDLMSRTRIFRPY